MASCPGAGGEDGDQQVDPDPRVWTGQALVVMGVKVRGGERLR